MKFVHLRRKYYPHFSFQCDFDQLDLSISLNFFDCPECCCLCSLKASPSRRKLYNPAKNILHFESNLVLLVFHDLSLFRLTALDSGKLEHDPCKGLFQILFELNFLCFFYHHPTEVQPKGEYV